MLHALREVQRNSPPGHFELGVCTIDPGTTAFDPRPLVAYVRSLQLPMHYVSTPIFASAETSMQGDSICAFCARLKRGELAAECALKGVDHRAWWHRGRPVGQHRAAFAVVEHVARLAGRRTAQLHV
jgi:tRNA(Ile)-lysidine synthase TilS/MesJ